MLSGECEETEWRPSRRTAKDHSASPGEIGKRSRRVGKEYSLFLGLFPVPENVVCFQRDVLIRGGNAVDAAIATVICEGGLRPHATGFGGGLVMLLHDRNKNETIVISAYSAAPRSATEETFIVNPALAEIGSCTSGVICGLQKRPGSMETWNINITSVLSRIFFNRDSGVLAWDLDGIQEIWVLKKFILDSALIVIPHTEVLFRDPIHAAFLRRFAIARDPVELFYRGDIANQIIHEMKQREIGGVIIVYMNHSKCCNPKVGDNLSSQEEKFVPYYLSRFSLQVT
ncbi:hypothetical protein OSTOST_20745 [Ostertagia ostertagi]